MSVASASRWKSGAGGWRWRQEHAPPPLRSMIATTFTPKPPISGSSPSVHPALTIERWCRPRWPRRCTWVPPNQLAASSLFTSCALHSLIHFDVDEVLILNNHECRNVEHTSWKHSLLFSLSPAVSLFMRSGPHPPFANTLRSSNYDVKLQFRSCKIYLHPIPSEGLHLG